MTTQQTLTNSLADLPPTVQGALSAAGGSR